MLRFKEFLSEAKVVSFENKKYGNLVVMLGTPGSGKSYIAKNYIDIYNEIYINVDKERELFAKVHGIDITIPENLEKVRKELGGTTDKKNRTIRKLFNILSGRSSFLENILLDSGGQEPEFISDVIKLANEKGYKTTLVYVYTTLDTSIKRNLTRKDRSVTIKQIEEYYEKCKKSFELTKDLYDNVWKVYNEKEDYRFLKGMISDKPYKWERDIEKVVKIK